MTSTDPFDQGELKEIALEATPLIKGFADSNQGDAKLQGFITQTYRDIAHQKFPQKNAIVVFSHTERTGPNHDPKPEGFSRNFVNEKGGFLTIFVSSDVRAKIYNLYVFDSGDCTLFTDGGFENWAWVGADGAPDPVQDGGHVVFFPVPPPPPDPAPPSKPSDTPHPPPPAPTPPAPTAERPDGVYLVNSFRGDEKSSGLAYYKNMTFGGNNGQQPDDYIDISHGNVVNWGGHHSGTFKNGTVFTVFLNDDAEDQIHPINAQVGTASNTFRSMVVYKDVQRVLYEIDGWQVFTLFWCN